MKTKLFILLALLLFSTCLLFAQSVGTATAQLKVTSVCETDSIRFQVVNIGNADLEEEVKYYVIEDEIIGRGEINQLAQGDSVAFVVRYEGDEISFEVQQVGEQDRMVGQQVSNCGEPVLRKTKELEGKWNQKVTGKLNDPWAIGIYVGTLGPGLSISKHINNKITLRLGGTYAPLNLGNFIPLDGAESEVKMKLGTVDFKVDYFISNNPRNKFHLIFGGVYNFSEVRIDSRPVEESYSFGNMEVDRGEIGEIDLTIRPNKFNPYLGLGFGRLANYNKRVGFKVELGGLFIGSPEAEFNASGLVEPTASQEEQINQNLKQYYIYPSINLFMSVKL